ncbi:MAG: FecR domain-containing protein [Xanthomonadales bacterium]|nr:FecR domain-containing protein [Xanthomonadales bacterium]
MSHVRDHHEPRLDHAAAAAWYARLRSDSCDAAERSAFDAWMSADTANRLAYADIAAAAWAAEQAPGIAESDSVPVVTSARPAGHGPPAWTRLMVALLAVSLLWLLPLGHWWDDARSDWVTGRGEVREQVLEDGTRLWLAADSAVSHDFRDDRRRLQLLRGAVYVQVVSDPARPFVIESGDVSATALGTRYSVSRRGAHRVAVEEGRVAVAHSGATEQLVAGEALVCAANGCAGERVSSSDVASWRDGVLRFERSGLAEVVEALGAHLSRPVLVLTDLDAGVRVTAVVQAKDAESALRSICQRHGLSLQKWGPWWVVRA